MKHCDAASGLRRHLSGSGSVIVAAMLWGTVGPATVFASVSIQAAALGSVRLLLGGLGLAAVAGRRFLSRSVLAGQRLPCLLIAALSTAVFQAAFLSAVSRSGAAVATVVTLGTAPVATGIVALCWMGERMTRNWAAGTGLALAGLVLLCHPGGSQVSFSGTLLALVGGICYGVYTVALKKIAIFSPNVPVREIASYVAVTLLAGGVALLPALAVDAEGFGDLRAASLVIWLGLAATMAAYLLFVLGLQRVSASTAGTLSLAEPLATAFLSWFWLRESLPLVTALGGLTMLAGIVVCSLPAGAPRGESPQVSFNRGT